MKLWYHITHPSLQMCMCGKARAAVITDLTSVFTESMVEYYPHICNGTLVLCVYTSWCVCLQYIVLLYAIEGGPKVNVGFGS